jgi:hypothetical protein
MGENKKVFFKMMLMGEVDGDGFGRLFCGNHENSIQLLVVVLKIP